MTDTFETHEAHVTPSTLYVGTPHLHPDEVSFDVADTGVGIMLSQAENKIAHLEKESQRLQHANERLREVESLLIAQTKVLADELLSYINKTNNDLQSRISCQDLDPPDYHDAQTVYEAYALLQSIKEQSL